MEDIPRHTELFLHPYTPLEVVLLVEKLPKEGGRTIAYWAEKLLIEKKANITLPARIRLRL